LISETDKIFNKLDQIQSIYGFTGVIIAIILIIGFWLIWRFLIKTVENQAKITFDKELADYNKKIQKELSQLNNDLSLITSKTIGNIDKEREAILEYLNFYTSWLYGSLQIDILSYKYNNFGDIDEILKGIRTAHSKCNQSWNKLIFWATNKDLIDASHHLNLSILQYSSYHETTLGKLRHNLSWGKIYNDSFDRIIDNIDQMKDWANFLASQDEKFRARNEDVIEEYWQGRSKLYRDVVLKNSEFQTIARKYLNHENKQ
jgi:hypothetical protein